MKPAASPSSAEKRRGSPSRGHCLDWLRCRRRNTGLRGIAAQRCNALKLHNQLKSKKETEPLAARNPGQTKHYSYTSQPAPTRRDCFSVLYRKYLFRSQRLLWLHCTLKNTSFFSIVPLQHILAVFKSVGRSQLTLGFLWKDLFFNELHLAAVDDDDKSRQFAIVRWIWIKWQLIG